MQHVINERMYKKEMQLGAKSCCITYSRKTAVKAERYKWCDKQGVGLIKHAPLQGVGCGMVYKIDLMLVMETTWIFVVAFLLPWLLHRESSGSTAGQGL